MDSAESQQLLANLKKLEAEKISLINKINDLELEKKEYKLVLDVFEKIEPSRKCCRMVGGVLVPRTVAEVKPALQASNDKITILLTNMTEELTRISKQHAEIASKLEPLLTERLNEKPSSDSVKRDVKGGSGGGGGGGVLI